VESKKFIQKVHLCLTVASDIFNSAKYRERNFGKDIIKRNYYFLFTVELVILFNSNLVISFIVCVVENSAVPFKKSIYLFLERKEIEILGAGK
jgi:hypothetical protein